MRRLLAVAALTATSFVLPAAPASAVYCGELDPVCRLLCELRNICVR